MRNFLMGCYHSGRTGQSCPVAEGMGATGVELAIGGGIVAVAGTACYFIGAWRGRKAGPADETKKAE